MSADGRRAACRRVEAGAWLAKTDKGGAPVYIHRLDGTTAAPPADPPPAMSGPAPERANADALHRVYSALLAALRLSLAHREALRTRGLDDATIDRAGYGTLPINGRARLARDLHERFGDAALRVPGVIVREGDRGRYLTIAGRAGLLVPVRDLTGRVIALKIRRDAEGDECRYSYLSSTRYGGPGPGSPVHVPLGTSPAEIVRVTEGEIKADVAAALSGLATIAIPGVGSWRLALEALKALGCRTVRVALDADARDNPAVARALRDLAAGIEAEGLAVELERWPAEHKGIDDALAAGVIVKVLAGDAARDTIGQTVKAAGVRPETPIAALGRRLDDAIGKGVEALYRDRELLVDLARLAETDPGEWACVRARLSRASVRLRDLDKAIAPHRQEVRRERPAPDAVGCYRIVAGRIVRDVLTNDGSVETPLTNWAGRIVEEIVHDDGAERRVVLAIEGALFDGTPLPRVEVTADTFPYMRWPVGAWGARAVVLAGPTTADHVRVALQLLSGDVPRRTVFSHTGWREIGGQWVYLHGGGAIGEAGPVDGVEVHLLGALEGMTLPVPPAGPALVEAIRASVRMLDVAPDRITVPLFGAVVRGVLGDTDFGLHLTGPTGNGKTELAALAQQHFGAMLDARHLPGSWSSTGNALEGMLFTAKDALTVIDDFAPGGQTADVARMHREADRVFRAQGNRAGRARCRQDGTLRPARPPRGLICSTGEDTPRGQSLRARLFVLDLAPGDAYWTHLTLCQRDAAAGRYAQTLASYLRWLARRYRDLHGGELARRRASLRDRVLAESAGGHARTPGIAADLALALELFGEFAVEAGALSEGERVAFNSRCWKALRDAAAAQADHVEAAEPCAHFLRLLAAALASGRAHLAGTDGGAPAAADAWGWRTTTLGNGQFARDAWQAQGRRVGWIDGVAIYLDPDASYAEAQELARQQGDSLPVAPRTLWRRMHERGLLASRDETRQRCTVRRTLGGQIRAVLHLDARTVCAESAAPCSPPSSALSKPSNGQKERDGSVDRSLDGREEASPDRPTGPSNGTAPEPDGTSPLEGLDGLDGHADARGGNRPQSPHTAHTPRWRGTI